LRAWRTIATALRAIADADVRRRLWAVSRRVGCTSIVSTPRLAARFRAARIVVVVMNQL
jgi:hypothetical protein